MESKHDEMLKIAEQCGLCRCGCCKDQCPMYSEILEESISPKGRNALIRAVMKGVLDPDERAVRIAFSCLLCKRDESSCTAKLDNAAATELFREYLLSRGAKPLPEHDTLLKSLENYGNPWLEPKSARKRWAKEFNRRKVNPGKTDTLFYVGCTYALDRSIQESPKALARLMESAGVDFGLLLDDELCCGSTAKRIGQVGLFDNLRKENEKRIRSTGVKRVVTACSGCYKTLIQDYPGLNKDVEILHSTEFIWKMISDGTLRFQKHPVVVTYHDPCHLGRHSEIYDAPRLILKSVPGLRLIEMANNRALSRCCGGGAGVKTAYPEVSQQAAIRRVREAEKTSAKVLVTTCPFCVQTLRSAANSLGSKLEILELSVLLERALDVGGKR